MAGALDTITQLAHDAAAAVFDTPDGQVVYQQYDARAQTWVFRRWLDAPGVWSEQDQWFTDWNATAEVSPAAPLPLVLDSCTVGWEPVWRSSRGQIINHITLAYGPTPDGGTQPTVTAQDTTSITRFGLRHYGENTQLSDQGSAQYRAGLGIDLQSWPHWALAQLDIYVDDLPPAQRAKVMALRCGDRVHLTGLPMPAPQPEAVLVVEGWTHTLTATRSVLTLNLSDPNQSYAGITWGALPPAGTTPPLRWQDCPPALIWADAIGLPNLQPTRSP